jgi:hypothetical protein
MLSLSWRAAEEVYAPLSGKETGDLTIRGGRYTPEFIWNVKWQDQVGHAPDQGQWRFATYTIFEERVAVLLAGVACMLSKAHGRRSAACLNV